MGLNIFIALCQYLATDAIALLVFLLIGHIVITTVLPQLSDNGSYKSVFVKLFSGILVVIFTYAQIRSRFATVFLLCYPVLLFLLAYRYFKKKGSLTFPRQYFMEIQIRQIGLTWIKTSLICFVVFLAFVFLLWNRHCGNFRVPFNDFIVYSNISNELNTSGIENYFYQPFLYSGYPLSAVNSLYHYPELWMNSLIIFFTGKASVLNFFFVTSSVLITAVIVGILSLFERYTAIGIKTFVVVLFLVNISGIYLPFYESYALTDYWVGQLTPNFISHPKYSFTAMVFICSVLLILDHLGVYALLILLILPVMNVAHFPAVIPGGIIFAMLLYFSGNKWMSRKELAYIVLCYFLFAVVYYFYTIYFCNSLSNKAISHNLLNDIVSSTEHWVPVRMYFANIYKVIARGVVLYLPFMIVLPLIYFFDTAIRKHYNRQHVLIGFLSLLFVLCGALSSYFVSHVPDNTQLLYNNLPFLNISIILILIPLLVNFKQLALLSKTVLVAIFVLSTVSQVNNIYGRFEETLCKEFNGYGCDYMAKVISVINTNNCKFGGYWLGKRQYQTTTYTYTLLNRPAPFLCLNDSFCDIVDLSNHYSIDNPDNTEMDSECLSNTPFHRYLKNRNVALDSASIAKQQYSFMVQNNISFGFTNDLQNIPPEIMTKQTSILKDSVSGEYFVTFRL